MTTLLASSTATNAAATESDVKTFLTNLRDYIADTLGTDSTNKGAIAGLLGSLLHGKVDKSGAYTVVAADRGKVINATGTWTLSLTAAATLGDGFTFAIRNVGTGAITIDPNLSEQINGRTTLVIGGGEFVIIYCDGTGYSSVGGSAAPSGAVVAFAMNSAPIGWLACDGSAVSRTTYSVLFSAIGTTYGAGNGSTTFNLPDLRGYFLRGSGTNSDGSASGSFGAKQQDDFKAHNHSISTASSGASWINISVAPVGNGPLTATGYTDHSGGSETRPKNIAMLYCIKT